MIRSPTIRPKPGFDSQREAEALHKAMEGKGCDKDAILTLIVECTNNQRQLVSRTYLGNFKKSLADDLKKELSGDFEELIVALMEEPADYDAKQLHAAMKGLGTRENVLIEIFTSRTNAQLAQIKQAYSRLFQKSLEKDVVGDTSGFFKDLLVALCNGARDESGITSQTRAKEFADYLAVKDTLKKDEAKFVEVLTHLNFRQIRLVFDEFQKRTSVTIEKAIEKEFSGDLRDALLAIVKVIRNRRVYFAELLNNSMKGLGTRDTDLIRLIVTRSEVDLREVANEYYKLYGKHLKDAIESETSGIYKKCLIALVNGNH